MAALRFRELPAMVPGKLDVFMADPRLIIVDAEYNCRDMKSAETLAHVDWLADEIENTGFNPEMPLTVKRRGADTVLVRGHCRLAALLKLIAKGIEVAGVPVMQIAAGTSDIDLIFDQEASNYGLRLDPLARARLVLKAKRLGVSDDEIAKRMHWKSTASVKQHLEILELSEPIKQIVRDDGASVTTAVRAMKDAKNDPDFAAQLLRDAADEQRRLGKKGKATPKALKAASERARPKPPAETKPQPKAPPIPEQTAQPHAPAETSQSNVDSFKPEFVPLSEMQSPRPANRIEALLYGFIAANAPELALQYAKLCRELEEIKAEAGDAMQGQEELCLAADLIGALRFPEDWADAKATTELAQVA